MDFNKDVYERAREIIKAVCAKSYYYTTVTLRVKMTDDIKEYGVNNYMCELWWAIHDAIEGTDIADWDFSWEDAKTWLTFNQSEIQLDGEF